MAAKEEKHTSIRIFEFAKAAWDVPSCRRWNCWWPWAYLMAEFLDYWLPSTVYNSKGDRDGKREREIEFAFLACCVWRVALGTWLHLGNAAAPTAECLVFDKCSRDRMSAFLTTVGTNHV